MNNTPINTNKRADKNLYLLQQELNAKIKIDDLLKRRSRKGGFVSWPQRFECSTTQKKELNKRN